jgi:alanine racemase
VPAGAAVKANGYGLGASDVVEALSAAGCRDFFVSSWWEAEQILTDDDVSLAVLHGVGPDDLAAALASKARPVLNTDRQVARWKQAAPGRIADVMIDTGINRLGLTADEASVLDGLPIHTLHSHFACADEDHPLNQLQIERFKAAAATIRAQRYSLANSAGILLGRSASFDLVRPGLALYGGIPTEKGRGHIRQVASVHAQVVQRRTIRAGDSSGYGATFVAERDTEAAVINIGYADGYWRGFSSKGAALIGEQLLPVIGRVSMDLVVLDCSSAPEVTEGTWVEVDFELSQAAAQSGQSQYELLTGLGDRYERVWT